jgi:hypothetical protein
LLCLLFSRVIDPLRSRIGLSRLPVREKTWRRCLGCPRGSSCGRTARVSCGLQCQFRCVPAASCLVAFRKLANIGKNYDPAYSKLHRRTAIGIAAGCCYRMKGRSPSLDRAMQYVCTAKSNAACSQAGNAAEMGDSEPAFAEGDALLTAGGYNLRGRPVEEQAACAHLLAPLILMMKVPAIP